MDIVVSFLQRLQWLDKATFPVEKRDAASGLVEPLAQHNVKNESNPYSIPPIAPPEDHLPPFKHTSADLPSSDPLSSRQDNVHYVDHHDATTAAAARRECVLDLYELLLARCDLVVTVCRNTAVRQRSLHYGDDDSDKQGGGTGDGMVVTLSSFDAEKLLGRHPCSATALFLLQNGLSGGTMSEIRLQYNHQRHYKYNTGDNKTAGVETQAPSEGRRIRQASMQGPGNPAFAISSINIPKTDDMDSKGSLATPNKVKKAVNLLRNRFGTYGSQRALQKSNQAVTANEDKKSNKSKVANRLRSSILSLAMGA